MKKLKIVFLGITILTGLILLSGCRTDVNDVNGNPEDYRFIKIYENGCSALITEADKFDSLEKAKKELENYDDDFNGAIYRVKETTMREIQKAE